MAPRSPWAKALRVFNTRSSTAVSVRLVRSVRAIRPVHAIQPLALGPLDPVRNGGDTNAEAAGDNAQGLAAPDSGYHGSTTLGLPLCLLMELPPDGSVLRVL